MAMSGSPGPSKDADAGPVSVDGPCWFCPFCWFKNPRKYFASASGLDNHFKASHGELYPAFRGKDWPILKRCVYCGEYFLPFSLVFRTKLGNFVWLTGWLIMLFFSFFRLQDGPLGGHRTTHGRLPPHHHGRISRAHELEGDQDPRGSSALSP